jgi:hypothetical protein
MAMKELIDELQSQLESDLLSYGWILQIARECGASEENRPITEIVYDAVTTLLTEGLAEIGDTRAESNSATDDVFGGTTEFEAWPGSIEDQKSRLRQEINRWGENPSLGDGFWLARSLSD